MMIILQKLLAFFAKRVLSRYQPKVIGITGSIGKTSAKEAVFMVLKNKYKVRRNIKNYNNEIGVPLTVIGAESGGKSMIKWMKIFYKAVGLWLKRDKKYPEVLILEMGADKPGDIKYLTDLVKPNIGILTKISPVHVESFGSIEAIAREKSILIKKLTADKIAILNFDDENVKNLNDKTKAKVISYGYSKDCDVRVVGADISIEYGKVKGISFKLSYEGSTVPMFLPQVIGFHQLYAAMAGAAAGIALGMNMVDISQALKIYRAPKGRMQIIEGINDSLIIDDSYNSSPESAKEALRAASQIPCQGQRMAALGDMLELGEMEKDLHQKLGEQAVKMGFEKIYAVGKFANFIRKGASLAGLSLKNIKVFENSKKAAQTIKDEINGGDIIMVKGSQGARMERVTKALMANPQRASQLLVRQSKTWLNR